MRSTLPKILTILAATITVFVATVVCTPELLPQFAKKYIQMIQEKKEVRAILT
jgi:hypothetical protein